MNFKSIISEFRIRLNNSLFLSRVVALLGLLNLIVFGFLTFTSITSLIERHNLYNQFATDSKALDEKLAFLEKNAPYEVTYDGYINSLFYAIPKSVDLQEYLTILNLSAGKAGFILKSFRPSVDGANTVSFYADFRGGAENIPELIKSVENLPRLTLIKSIKATREKNLFRVEINALLFYLGER